MNLMDTRPPWLRAKWLHAVFMLFSLVFIVFIVGYLKITLPDSFWSGIGVSFPILAAAYQAAQSHVDASRVKASGNLGQSEKTSQ